MMKRRILFICDGNKDRSPTAEAIFNRKAGIIARSAGIKNNAMRVVDQKMLDWADIIIVMVKAQERFLKRNFLVSKNIYSLGVPDIYDCMDPRLVRRIKNRIRLLKINYS
jgi:predicted protein tyrosine phosphatase